MEEESQECRISGTPNLFGEICVWIISHGVRQQTKWRRLLGGDDRNQRQIFSARSQHTHTYTQGHNNAQIRYASVVDVGHHHLQTQMNLTVTGMVVSRAFFQLLKTGTFRVIARPMLYCFFSLVFEARNGCVGHFADPVTSFDWGFRLRAKTNKTGRIQNSNKQRMHLYHDDIMLYNFILYKYRAF